MRLDKQKLEDRMEAVGIKNFYDLAARIGVAQETMSRYVSGTYWPSKGKMEALCTTLQCTVNDIVVYDSPKVAALAVS